MPKGKHGMKLSCKGTGASDMGNKEIARKLKQLGRRRRWWWLWILSITFVVYFFFIHSWHLEFVAILLYSMRLCFTFFYTQFRESIYDCCYIDSIVSYTYFICEIPS